MYACGNGRQLQPQKEEIVCLTKKSLKGDLFLFLHKDRKETKKRLFDPQKGSEVTLGVQRVTFNSRFAAKRRKPPLRPLKDLFCLCSF